MKNKISFKVNKEQNVDYRWIIKTFILTFFLAMMFSIASTGCMKYVNIYFACIVLLFIIFLGILFDIVGVAVTTAKEAPFHAMASQKIIGADQAISLIKMKDKVSNFCNDVVGDICGTISGAAAATVVEYIFILNPRINTFILSLIFTATVAALTVGGKAAGKSIAIRHSNRIVYITARVLSLKDAVFHKKNNRPKKR